ncbi:glutaredoxin family protein [Patescibacteria group bacterium]|nr:glutaredoxin family protein [Patescibacteria group bacterium]
MKNVTIYSTPTCSYCNASKAFFKENNIDYKEIDVASDQAVGQEMVAKSGQMGVPVIIVEDGEKEEIVVGFDQPRLINLLNIKN